MSCKEIQTLGDRGRNNLIKRSILGLRILIILLMMIIICDAYDEIGDNDRVVVIRIV